MKVSVKGEIRTVNSQEIRNILHHRGYQWNAVREITYGLCLRMDLTPSQKWVAAYFILEDCDVTLEFPTK